MKMNFNSRVELLSYIERRTIIDIDRLSKTLIHIPDIFKPSPYGVYNAQTGECVVDFGKESYCIDEHDRELILRDWTDFERVKSDIYDHTGRVTLRRRRLDQYTFVEDKPVFFKAQEVAAAMYAERLKTDFRFSIIARNIPVLEDLVFQDVIDDSKKFREVVERLNAVIWRNALDEFEEDEWKKLHFHRRNSTYLVDVMLDHRIEDYHLREFDRIDKEREQEEDDCYEGRRIRNS